MRSRSEGLLRRGFIGPAQDSHNIPTLQPATISPLRNSLSVRIRKTGKPTNAMRACVILRSGVREGTRLLTGVAEPTEGRNSVCRTYTPGKEIAHLVLQREYVEHS